MILKIRQRSIIVFGIVVMMFSKNIAAGRLLLKNGANTLDIELIDKNDIDGDLAEHRKIYNEAFWAARVQSGLEKGDDEAARCHFFELISNGMDEVKKLLIENPAQTFGLSAKQDGKLVGFMIFSQEKGGDVYINQCAIHPDCWNHGIATTLGKVIKSTLVPDAKKLVWMARRKNKVATQFYDHLQKYGVKVAAYVHEGLSPEVYQGYELPLELDTTIHSVACL